MASWSIGHPEKEQLVVEFTPTSDPTGEVFWYPTRVTIDVVGFSGRTRTEGITLYQMKQFLKELGAVYTELRGKAEFDSFCGGLHVELEADRVGHITVQGSLRDDFGIGNRLIFNFQLDQTFLPQTISELRECVALCEKISPNKE
ncbi:hypothetical protein KQI84_09765 [bacterium]|nr:hypothetical protein [bacterium]